MEFTQRKGSNMKKRILCLALVMVMIFTLLPVSGFAATYDGASYSTDYANWKQGSYPWGNKTLGDLCTMADSGCLITSIAILMAKSGAEDPEYFCPGTLRDRYETKGYVSHNSSDIRFDGNLSNEAYTQANQPNFYYSGYSDFSPTPYGEIYNTLRSKLNAGYYAIVNVKNGGHFVAVNYCSDGEVYIYDPGYTGRTKLSFYDGGIVSATYFKAISSVATTIEEAKSIIPTNIVVKVTNSSNYLKSLPCSQSTNQNSVNKGKTNVGDRFEVHNIILNTQGNYWYEVKNSAGEKCYL